ncbi:heterokaryon incompatibility protein-domain-containing protein [Triangularia setosa]|uniref:Heterokaryon incompatibility protein-domain-containing protein n=1 Tax=Triangularia setosa TaxID=2587417 RepID=A0AAN6VZW4_9PEZI|nr:heterokaryon incompatibility protein-domain-containing protein [Podospora setosa]
MDPGTFRYQVLTSPNAIRLLVLEPSQDQNEALRGSLVHTTLEECDCELIEPYTALSYVWGDPAQTGTLTLSGHVFTITATLAAALRDLRDDTRPRRIWADALCINQTNIPERNNQVSLMGLIYRVAGHTVIYLGSSTAETDKVLQSAPHSSMEVYPSLGQSQRHDIVQEAKFQVLNRSWFFRVWIFQELILSRDPWVQIGRRRVRWKDFCQLVLRNGPTSLVRGKPDDGQEPLRMLDRMNQSYINGSGGSNAGTMLALLKARRGLGATDARDFVFAHMGIASDRWNVGQSVPVDYRSSLGHVFASMAFYILETERVETFINILDEQAAGVSNDLPSWAPDWRIKPSSCAPMYKKNKLTHARVLIDLKLFLKKENILGLLGHSVGIVKDVSVTLPMSSALNLNDMVRYQDTVNKIVALYNSTGGVYYRGDSNGQHAMVSVRNREQEHMELCEVLFVEWVEFLQPQQETSPNAAPHQHEHFVHSLREWTRRQLGKQRIFVTGESSDVLYIMWTYLHPKATASSLDGRRLATTHDGKLGVVPAQTQKGDYVVNVMGSEVALVVRPVNVELKEEKRINKSLRVKLSAVKPDTKTGSRHPQYIDRLPMHGPVVDIEHYAVIGSCCLDGIDPWAVSQLPMDGSELRIFALH